MKKYTNSRKHRKPKPSSPSSVAMGVLSGVTMLLGGVEVAVASMSIPQTQTSPDATFDLDGALISGTNVVEFNLFNSNLGTLTGVSISLAGTTVSLEANFNPPDSLGNAATFTAEGTFLVNFSNVSTDPFPGGNPWSFATLSQSWDCSPGESVVCSDPSGDATGTLDNTATYNAALGAFAAPGGGTFDVTFGLTELSGVDGEFFPGALLSLAAASSDNFTITYTYDPASAVPEPGSVGLTALGLGALAYSRRRRKLR